MATVVQWPVGIAGRGNEGGYLRQCNKGLDRLLGAPGQQIQAYWVKQIK